ncbi:Hypothetical protein NGAL_HAMBI2566_62050 [Neorhizobium galegae bv. orientalis]|nr:Hypothetical protein NGAL_HAMBI2566_62050 [Neorhizobium galegae bv. orientalis]
MINGKRRDEGQLLIMTIPGPLFMKIFTKPLDE